MLRQEDIEAEFKDLQDDLLSQQKKTFTKWVNSYLGDNKVVDLFEDFSDGEKLLQLLEVISGHKIGKISTGKTKFHKIENVNKCLHFLNSKVHLENIGAEDIIKGNPRLIMGLLWTIIIGFQIQDIFVSDEGNNQRMARTSKTARESLLLWCQQRTAGYRWIHIDNFSSSWRDGMAFCALIDSERKDLIQYYNLNRGDHLKNLEKAFSIAEKELRIPRLIDPEDVDVDHPDEKSIMTYLSQFYHVFMKSPNWERITGRTATKAFDGLANDDIDIIDKSIQNRELGKKSTPNGYLNDGSRWTDFKDRTKQTEPTFRVPVSNIRKSSLEREISSTYLQESKSDKSQQKDNRQVQERKISLGSLEQNIERPSYLNADRTWASFNDKTKQRSTPAINYSTKPSSPSLTPLRRESTSRSLINITENQKQLDESRENAKRKLSFENIDRNISNGHLEDRNREINSVDKNKLSPVTAMPFATTTSTTKTPSDNSKAKPEDAWACSHCPSINLSTSIICGSCKKSKYDQPSPSGPNDYSFKTSTYTSSLSTSSKPFTSNLGSSKYLTSNDRQSLSSSSSPFGPLRREMLVKASSSSSLNASSLSSSSPFTSNLASTKYSSNDSQQWKNTDFTKTSPVQAIKTDTLSSNKTDVENNRNNVYKTDSLPLRDKKESTTTNLWGNATRWSSNVSTKNAQNVIGTSNSTSNYKIHEAKVEISKESLETRVTRLENEVNEMKHKYEKDLEETSSRLRDITAQVNLLRNENERLMNELDEVPLIKNKMNRMEQMLHKIAVDTRRY